MDIKIVLWILLIFTPFWYNYQMKKVGAYKLFKPIHMITSVIGFTFVTCIGIFLLGEIFNSFEKGLMFTLYLLAFIFHLSLAIGEIKEPYKEDPHYPYEN